jgi:hypothetical protein
MTSAVVAIRRPSFADGGKVATRAVFIGLASKIVGGRAWT